MKINRLVIENFKSIERIELLEPNPFTVFVGPNGSGKSNIFEALEFFNLSRRNYESRSLFGGPDTYLYRNRTQDRLSFHFSSEEITLENSYSEEGDIFSRFSELTQKGTENKFASEQDVETLLEKHGSEDFDQVIKNFSRLFVKNESLQKINLSDDRRLSLSAINLEKVLKRVLSEDTLKEEIFEWLELFVPSFKSVEVAENPFDGRETLLWFEQSSNKPFTKDLISDGTYNILALLTAVYQSDDKPQFLCIEEPENGLHPQVLMSLVDFFRQQCKEKGHYIWLNTHSESLVRGLTTDEIILVNKVDGATQTRQIKGRNIYDLPTDEAWLTGALGGGLPW